MLFYNIGFILLSCLRGWISAILFTFLYRISTKKLDDNKDFLGQLGNGSLFFSGISSTFQNINEKGLPNLLIRGLACPQKVSLVDAKNSKIFSTLLEYDALNSTNLELLRIILCYKDLPVYIPKPGDDIGSDEKKILNSNIEYTFELLEIALLIHRLYSENIFEESKLESSLYELTNKLVSGYLANNNSAEDNESNNEKHEELLEDTFDKVYNLGMSLNFSLTDSMKKEIASFTKTELSSIILSIQAGKTLAFNFEGGRWVRKTNFIELSSRAVLHSIKTFDEDYNYDQRNEIRRSIIYGSRNSVYAPISLPIDISRKVLSARQWVELLISSPLDLEQNASILELFGMAREFQDKFIQAIKEFCLSKESGIF